MSNYTSLKATIDANIKQNDNQEITGVILNSVLNEMVDNLAAGYLFKGVASTSTNPGTPDEKVFYLGGEGSYTYFGQPTIEKGNLGVFWYDTSWHSGSILVAPVIDIVNNLNEGGSEAVLSAEMGKVLGEYILGFFGSLTNANLTADDYSSYTTSGAKSRGYIAIKVNRSNPFVGRVSVKAGSPVQYAFTLRTSKTNPDTNLYDTGWATAGQSKEVTADDLSTDNDVYLVLSATYAATNTGVPTYSEFLQYADFELANGIREGGMLQDIDELQGEVFGQDTTEEITNLNFPADDYSSYTTGQGNTRGLLMWDLHIPFVLTLSVAANSPIKVGVQGRATSSMSQSAGYDTGWLSPGTSWTSTLSDFKNHGYLYIDMVFTYVDGNTGIPTIEEVRNNVTFSYSYGAKTASLRDEIDELSSGLLSATFNSAYNQADTASARAKIGAVINGKEGEVETFLFFTDPHLTPNSRYEEMTELVRDNYISTLQKYYNSLPLDTCICGGDWLNSGHSNGDACAWLGYSDAYMRKLFRNYLPVFGNHDDNPYNPDTAQANWLKALTYVNVRNAMFRENGETYYDYEAKNTMFYVLNSGVSFIKTMTNTTYSRLVDNRWPQVDWLGQKLLSQDPDHSVIVLHIYSNATNESEWFANDSGYWAKGIHAFGANVKSLAMAYNSRQSITLNGITYNFSNCTGKVAFMICGHTHFDYVDTSGILPIVCVTDLEGGYLVNGEIIYALKPTFDNCVIDYENDCLYMVRVGAGVSRIIHFTPVSLASGSSETLTTNLSGTITWTTRNAGIATIANGVVSGVSAGVAGIIATDENGEQEYWTIAVS